MGLNIGDKIPDFNLKGADGKFYSLEDFKDKKILAIAFTCNHCPYVKAYEDRLIAIQNEFADKGVVLVAINSNDEVNYPEDSFDNMVTRANEKGFPFPYLRDETQEIARAFGAERTPHVFVFDSNRILCYKGRVDDNWEYPEQVEKKEFREALNELLEGKEVSVKETEPVGCSIKWK